MHFVLESVKSKCRLKSRIVNMPAKGNPPLLRLTRHERWPTTLLLDTATGNAGDVPPVSVAQGFGVQGLI